jgi:hypothetical protein
MYANERELEGDERNLARTEFATPLFTSPPEHMYPVMVIVPLLVV